jgi:hypothetical protein
MRVARLLTPALVLAASVAHATPAQAWTNVTYKGAATIDDSGSVRSDADVRDSYTEADGSTLFLIDYADARRSDHFNLSPFGDRSFTVTWAGIGTAHCQRDGDESVYANRIAVSGPGWATTGGTAAANVACVVGTTRYLFDYAPGGVKVTREGNRWDLVSTGPATVSTLNNKGKWVPVATGQPVTFNVSFTGSPA